jgi:hypothetical protein
MTGFKSQEPRKPALTFSTPTGLSTHPALQHLEQ